MFAPVDSLIGLQQIQSIYAVDSAARLQPGMLITAVDPWWGAGEFIYVRAAGSIRQFGLCVLTPVFDSALNAYRYDMTEAPNTANLGRAVVVAMAPMVSGNYGWACCAGIVPVNSNASVAADSTFGIGAAGQGSTNSAGRQVLNARIIAAASTTVAKAGCQAASGSLKLTVPNSDGWFVGVYLSGTGIAAGTTVSSISPDGRTVTLSAATTAVVAGTVTATYNNATVFYNVAHLNRPFLQGAIT